MSNQTRKEVLEEKQCVILKGRRDGISIHLDDKADFNLIKDLLRKRVADSRNFFDGAETAVNFKGRKLSPREEALLLEIIRYEANLHIAAPSPSQVEFKVPPPPPQILKLIPAAPSGLLSNEESTFFYRGAVRSGQVIRQNGSIVIVGDVNPGAEIKATGNIIVLGSLKGSAWAGAPGSGGGDTGSFVAALDFQPTQVRISHVLMYIPKDPQRAPSGNGAWAYIQDAAVYIAPL